MTIVLSSLCSVYRAGMRGQLAGTREPSWDYWKLAIIFRTIKIIIIIIIIFIIIMIMIMIILIKNISINYRI